MKKFILGVFVGIAFSSLCIVPLVISEGRVKFRLGVKKATDALENEFGRYDGHTPFKVLFSIDTTNTVSIETNGVKTVRVSHEVF